MAYILDPETGPQALPTRDGNGSSFVTHDPCDPSHSWPMTHDPWSLPLRMGQGGGVAWWYWTTLSVFRAKNRRSQLQGGPKNLAPFFLYVLTFRNINRFSKLFYHQNQEKICNNTVANNNTTPRWCRCTTLWNVIVLKATTENKTTSVTTHFKELTTGNNVFIVSVIVYM